MKEFSETTPKDIDLERKVLGTILTLGMKKEKKIFFPDLFFDKKNYIIARAIDNLIHNEKPYDLTAVTVFLKNHNVEDITEEYLMRITLTPPLYPLEFYLRILQQLWMKREMLKLFYNNYKNCYDRTSDSFEINDKVRERLENIMQRVLVNLNHKFSDDVSKSLEIIKKESSGESVRFLTGDKDFDTKAGLHPNSLVLLAAENKAGKTRFVIYLMKRMLQKYGNKLFIYWNTLEDPVDKIIRLLISEEVGLTDSQMLSDEYVLTKKERGKIEKAHKRIQGYDIIFNHKKITLDEMGKNFNKFCSKRQDKMNIIIVDNLMLVGDRDPRHPKNDAALAYSIDDWGIKMDEERNKIAFIVHHLGEEQMDEKRREEGYRARQEHVLGTDKSKSAIRNIMTHIFLINNPSLHPDLLDEFGEFRDILNDVFVLELAAARNKQNAVFRYFKKIEYSIFKQF